MHGSLRYLKRESGCKRLRKVIAAAIQPGYISIPEPYRCMSDTYTNHPGEIIENYVKAQLEVTAGLLEQAGKEGCDIVVTSEDMTGLTEYAMDITEKNIFPELAELSQVLAEARLAGIAAKHSMYVVGCFFKRAGGHICNTAVIFGRNGDIVGEYRKTHLPFNEKWQCTPGDDISVFELDFGKVGVCICYEMMFPEFMEVQSLKGAEIVLHPTLGYGWYDEIGEATLRTRANDNSVYIATSKNYSYNSAGKSSIIDFWGQVLSQGGFYENAVVKRELDLDFKKTQPHWHYSVQTSGIGEVNVRKSVERRPELYSGLSEPLQQEYRGPDRRQKLEVLERIRTGECHW